MSKRLEFSEDLKSWKVLGACEDSEFETKWAALQKWIVEQQPYGFFKAVDDARSVDDIFAELDTKL
jgi:hypothetical protein